jgi:hypothetical protein
MNGKIPASPMRLMVTAVAFALTVMAISAVTASAAPGKVVYNNLNTVPATVNGLPNEDTYSLDTEYFPVGGMVEFTKRPGALKSLTTEVDSFSCERGSYSLENCYTLHASKKFHYTMTADVYEVGTKGEELGPLIASSTATFKLRFRPTTNPTCPSTVEGKGFGGNCDVGGLLQKVTFKRFTPAAVLPERAIITLTDTAGDPASDIVNVGLQASYKEYKEGKFFEQLPTEGPEVGSNPLPAAIFTKNVINDGESWEGFQPVFEVTAKP